jgi:hypothetical protein
MTIADVRGAASDGEHAERVRRWARVVWAAYAAQHGTAREWLGLAIDHAARTGRSERRARHVARIP